MSIIRKALYGLGAAAIVAAIAVPAASAAQTGASQPGNYVSLPGTTRVVPTPGQHLAAGQTATVQVTGTRAGQADAGALAVVVQLTSVTPTAAGSLVVYTGTSGAPGNPTVQYSRGQENTATTTVGLTPAGTLKVTARGSAVNFLLSVTGEYVAAAPAASPLAGAYYSVAKYDLGDTNGGAIATVACKAKTDTAISGGVQTIGLGATPTADNVPVSSSFPGRMDFTGDAGNNTPLAGRTDGWIVQFGTETGAAPKFVNIYALCVPGLSVPFDTTFTESGN